MKIYTKTGDCGETSLIGGQRTLKSNMRLECYGTADELNSFIGLLLAKINNQPQTIAELLLHIQNKLFGLGAFLADPTAPTNDNANWINEQDVKWVENSIDELSKDLQPTHGFILPNGNERVALCHICRTITRRLERNIVSLFLQNPDNNTPQNDIMPIKEKICLQYVNRLSDFFFILSRYVGQIDECEIFLWKK